MAEAFVEVLNRNGIKDLFFNPGGDLVPILEAIAKYRESDPSSVRGVICLDESVAMTAAHGHYMVSGQPQVVMVHSEVGTLQVGGTLHNAQWGRIPVVLFSTPRKPPERMNWREEPFDQGRIVRDCVKWDHQLGGGEDIHDVLREAIRIASTEPCGPVYLTVPREDLPLKIDRPRALDAARSNTAVPPEAEPEALDRAAEMLLNAEDPLIITGYLGRHPRAVASLVELAETLCARVVTSEIRMNFPTTHPLCAWTAHSSGPRNASPHIRTSDVLLVLDYDMPYVSTDALAPRPGARIIHIDIDTRKHGVPLYGRKADILLEADSGRAVPALTEIVRRKLTPELRRRLRDRFGRIEAENRKLRAEWHVMAVQKAGQRPIAPDWLCSCLAEVMDDDTVLLNQTLSGFPSMARQIRRSKPGTLLACAGGSVQWALGAALGAKLAAPDKTVVSLMGDGTFVYGCPVATLWTANRFKAPFLAVIFNNREYRGVKKVFRETYRVDNMGADIDPSPDFSLVAGSCNAHGRKVEDPGEVLPALREAMDRVRGGQAAVLDVKLERVE